jgi:prepilin-type N-terminal cleavage/methylation domain-containing protein
MRATRSFTPRTSAAERGVGQAGFTLVELMITVALLAVVLGVVFDSLIQMQSSESFQEDRSTSLDSMRLTLNQMTRDLRQAASINEATATTSHLEFTTYKLNEATPTTEDVTYNATGTTLTRKVDNGVARPVITNLQSTNLFTYTPAPMTTGVQWVAINLAIVPKNAPSTVLVLDGQVNLRNRTAAQL